MDDEQIAHLIQLTQADQKAQNRILAELNDRVLEIEGGAPAALVTEVAEDDVPVELVYDSLEEFVDGFVCVVFEAADTPGAGSPWCPEWQRHPGVEMFLTALWHAFEGARSSQAEDGGSHMIEFLENYFRPYMTYLTSSEGPFRLCNAKNHRDPALLGAGAA